MTIIERLGFLLGVDSSINIRSEITHNLMKFTKLIVAILLQLS